MRYKKKESTKREVSREERTGADAGEIKRRDGGNVCGTMEVLFSFLFGDSNVSKFPSVTMLVLLAGFLAFFPAMFIRRAIEELVHLSSVTS